MSELRSTIDSLRAETLADLPDARVEEDFAELHRAMELLEVERLRRLAEIERRRSFERDGHLSVAAWLASTFRVAWGSARAKVRLARAWSACRPRDADSRRASFRCRPSACSLRPTTWTPKPSDGRSLGSWRLPESTR